MSLALALLFSSPVVMLPLAAEPTVSPDKWIIAADFPKSSWKQPTVTTFDLAIDDKGKAVNCVIIIGSGSAVVDGTVCRSIVKRASFNPAKDASGLPTPSVRRDRVVWRPNSIGRSSWANAPDFVIATPSLRGKAKKMATVILSFDDSGIVKDCHLIKNTKIKSLDDQVCSIAQRNELSKPVVDRDGKATEGIRAFFIGFESGAIDKMTVR